MEACLEGTGSRSTHLGYVPHTEPTGPGRFRCAREVWAVGEERTGSSWLVNDAYMSSVVEKTCGSGYSTNEGTWGKTFTPGLPEPPEKSRVSRRLGFGRTESPRPPPCGGGEGVHVARGRRGRKRNKCGTRGRRHLCSRVPCGSVCGCPYVYGVRVLMCVRGRPSRGGDEGVSRRPGRRVSEWERRAGVAGNSRGVRVVRRTEDGRRWGGGRVRTPRPDRDLGTFRPKPT